MKEIIKLGALVILVLFFVACAARIANTIADLEPVPTKEFAQTNFSSAQISEGQSLYENNCAECHKLKNPANKTPEKWNNTLKKMLPKTKLTYEESRLVRAYLVVNSK